MANSADPDQLASSEANWSGSTLFAKRGTIVYPCSAGHGLSFYGEMRKLFQIYYQILLNRSSDKEHYILASTPQNQL